MDQSQKMHDERRSLRRRDFMKASVGTAGGLTLLTALNGTASAATGDPIPIGCPASLTGWAAADGIEFERGFRLAVEEINANGGILGRPIEPHVDDTGDQGPNLTTQSVRRLIDRNGVLGLVAGYNNTLGAEYDAVAEVGIPYLHCNTDITHDEMLAASPEDYFSIFMNDPAEYWYGAGLLHYLDRLKASGGWTPQNNKLAIVTGTVRYSTVIANAIRDNAEKHGWEVSLFETVTIPISEWGPTLSKIRQDPPAVIAVTHFLAQDLAAFMQQFSTDPTQSLVYMQYGPSLAAFREIGGKATEGVLYSTVVAALQDDIGNDFEQRYKARWGDSASHLVGGQTYDGMYILATAMALAGGPAEQGDFDGQKRIADRIRNLIYRGTVGVTHFSETQSAIPFPNATRDPSLGMPHQFLQIQDYQQTPVLIDPAPYDVASFTLPPWLRS